MHFVRLIIILLLFKYVIFEQDKVQPRNEYVKIQREKGFIFENLFYYIGTYCNNTKSSVKNIINNIL